ncbi:TniQ family protein [Streptomyces sp. NBC_01643]|uniref:TniQ family protein n=1 Tax=Streptomyces sp. NBC_01643 TaxID=2975906 RepID=UPI00386E159F|nr:TniQ family protein [Streptomyces sp. NBC_01643]
MNDAFLQPLADESLASWVNAMARHREVETTTLLRDLHLHRDGALSMAQARLSEPVARRVRRRTGVDEAVLHEMTLSRYSGNALPHLPLTPWTDSAAVEQWSSSAWLSRHRARWCAPCLRKNNFRWPLRWMLPWTFACLEHRLYLATECIRCLSPVHYGRHSTLPQSCDARVDERRHTHGYDDERCEYPIALHRPLPVTDDSVLLHQERINTWLEGSPTSGDRQFASLTAVMVMLVTPAMMRRRGEDPALLCHLRSRRGLGLTQERAPWTDPLRVAAAASVASRLLSPNASASDVARRIEDMRSLDYRESPWRLDVMEWAYGSTLRPNPYVDELVRRGVISIGSFGH